MSLMVQFESYLRVIKSVYVNFTTQSYTFCSCVLLLQFGLLSCESSLPFFWSVTSPLNKRTLFRVKSNKDIKIVPSF